jgi:uncharacterized membrane protein YbhN (UPF0104 family)
MRTTRPGSFLRIRHLLVLAIMVVCVGMTLQLFDWKQVARAIHDLDVNILLGGCLPILAAIFAIRGWRWLLVLGISPNRQRLWQSFCANGAAAGLASITPFQLGEVLKLRIIPDHHASAWRLGVSGFFAERILDFSGMFAAGIYGLMLHLGWARLAPLGWLSPIATGLMLCLLAPHVERLPERVKIYAESFRHKKRIVSAGILTIPTWLLYANLWRTAALALRIHLSFGSVSLLLGSVMTAVIASMTPGGLGVSELGTRGIMLWLGASVADADVTAIAIRLITPLTALAGAACLLTVLRLRSK